MPDGAALGIGVVGLGLVSRAHLDGYEQAEGCRLVRVCDVSQEKVDAVAAARTVPGTTDYAELLADPDDRRGRLASPPPHPP